MSRRKCGCVYADKGNTPAVRSGHELGGYLKEPCDQHKVLAEGEPCGHAGCLNHITHPCEGCGRVAGKSV